ncbi:MAG: sigma factor-like helix-turn-helix DNA-binding protein, partial [Ktedonobacterales bacterium]
MSVSRATCGEGKGDVAAEAHDANRLPPSGELVALARQRIVAELERVPVRSPALLRSWLRVPGRLDTLSPGAITRVLRGIAQRQDYALAGEVFVAVLGRIEGTNRRWADRATRSAGVEEREERVRLREDLRQDLTLHLWEQLALRTGEQWELFFWRALDYAQRHITTASLRKQGYRTQPDTKRPTRAFVQLLGRLSRYDDDERSMAGFDPADPADPADAFAAADLLDLRDLILSLPPAERMAIVMRYWQDASEHEIAAALGGVSTRTVRNRLRQARARLRGKYEETANP